MNKQQKNLVKENILKARALLEEDIADRLIKYGITKDPSKWLSVEKLKHLSSEDMQVRKNIIAAIEKQEQSSTKKEAYEQYLKEVVFTYVNRLAALRVLEVRGIIPTLLETKSEYGGKSPVYRDYFEVAGELCNSPDKGWQILLRLIFEEISTEIKVLFDPDDEFSIIFPSNQTISEIIRLFTEVITKDIWTEDEIIGWIYQYFNEKEKKEYKESKRKAKTLDVPVITQLYTPKWIVKYLIDNTLGAYWIEMHPDSKIKEYCTYYIKPEDLMKRDIKKVSEIKILDPACGSGHFLLQAFDVLYKMYLEEGIVVEKDIPTAILTNNLYGIDIDLRAIQLTALILFIKAKTYNKKAEIKQINVVAANAILKNDDNKEKLIKKIKNKLPGAEHLVETIWDSFANIREYGSLLRIENEIKTVVEEERANQKSTKLMQYEEFRKVNNQETITGFLSSDIYWQQVQDSIIEEVKILAKESLKTTDISQSMFAAEAEKTMHLLDFFFQKYDIVVTNPPYLDKRDMNSKLLNFLKKEYPENFVNSYSCFIDRAYELCIPNGFIGMLTPQSFMFLSSLISVRELMINNSGIKSLLHLGYGALEDAYVDLAAFILIKSTYQNSVVFFRLISDRINKDKEFEKCTQDIQNNKSNDLVYFKKQTELKNIPGKPFVYWIPKNLSQLFLEESLEKYINNTARTITGDNDKFLRFFWEVNKDEIGKNYARYTKGGEYGRWYQLMDYVIRWDKKTIEYFRKSKDCRITEEKYWFMQGITYTLISKKGWSARYLPKGFVFDMNGPCLFSKGRFEKDYPDFDNYLLGFLNSKLAIYFQHIINPTVAFQTIYLKRVPFILPTNKIKKEVESIVIDCINNKKEILDYNELSFDFDKPFLFNSKINNFKDIFNLNFDLTKKKLLKIDSAEDQLNNLIFELYGLEFTDRQFISTEFENTLSFYNNIKLLDEITYVSEIENILSYQIGLLFNRWQYAGIVPDEDGILSFDEERKDYVVKRIRDALEVIFGAENVDKREREITEALGKPLDKYFLTDFFKSHCKKYKKRPIYWHIQSPNKYFNCILYYHKLDNDTIYKIKSQYIDEKITEVGHKINGIISKINSEENDKEKAKLQKELSELRSEKEDLETINTLLQEIIDEGYTPNIDNGVKANILPFVKKGLIQLDLKLDKDESAGVEE